MAWITCRSCGQNIEDSFEKCPVCGSSNRVSGPGTGYEYKSSITLFDLPLVHIAFGKDEQGRRRIARGIVAIGQFGIGLITIAQVGIGVIFGIGQVIFGLTAVAQVAITAILGIGQLATGYVAAGQLVLAYYGLGQAGLAVHGWFVDRQDMEVARFMIDWGRKLGLSLEWLFSSG